MARGVLVTVLLVALVAGGADAAFTCVFLHGIGQAGPQTPTSNPAVDPNYARTSLPSYWGDMATRAANAGCTKSIFYWTDAVNRGWNSAALQAEYCNVIVAQGANVIFTHSMGNMIIAGAIKAGNRNCANIGRGQGQVHWVGLQGPLAGSPAADALPSICKIPAVPKMLGKECDGNTISAAYGSLETVYSTEAGLTAIATPRMLGNMCGVMPANFGARPDLTGIITYAENLIEKGIDDVGLAAIRGAVNTVNGGKIADWAVSNTWSNTVPTYGADGMVGFASCRVVALSYYKKDPTSPYYVLDGNHADGRCSFGEDPSSKSTMQCTYMQNMIRRSIAVHNGQQSAFFEVEADAVSDDSDETETEVVADDEAETEDESEAEDEAEGEEEAEVEADEEAEAEAEEEVEVADQ